MTVCMHVHSPVFAHCGSPSEYVESVELTLCLSGVRKSEIYIILCHNSFKGSNFLKKMKEL